MGQVRQVGIAGNHRPLTVQFRRLQDMNGDRDHEEINHRRDRKEDNGKRAADRVKPCHGGAVTSRRPYPVHCQRERESGCRHAGTVTHPAAALYPPQRGTPLFWRKPRQENNDRVPPIGLRMSV